MPDQRDELTPVDAQIDVAEDTKTFLAPCPPSGSILQGKYLLTRSMLRNDIALLRICDQSCESVEAGIQSDTDDSDDQNGEQDASNMQIVPFDPCQVPDAELA